MNEITQSDRGAAEAFAIKEHGPDEAWDPDRAYSRTAFIAGIRHERGKAQEPGEAQEGECDHVFEIGEDYLDYCRKCHRPIGEERAFRNFIQSRKQLSATKAALSSERSLVSSLQETVRKQKDYVTDAAIRCLAAGDENDSLRKQVEELKEEVAHQTTAKMIAFNNARDATSRVEELQNKLSDAQDWKETALEELALADRRISERDDKLKVAEEALEKAKKRFSHIENWHRDNVTPDFKDCQEIGMTPEFYLREGKRECHEALNALQGKPGNSGGKS